MLSSLHNQAIRAHCLILPSKCIEWGWWAAPKGQIYHLSDLRVRSGWFGGCPGGSSWWNTHSRSSKGFWWTWGHGVRVTGTFVTQKMALLIACHATIIIVERCLLPCPNWPIGSIVGQFEGQTCLWKAMEKNKHLKLGIWSDKCIATRMHQRHMGVTKRISVARIQVLQMYAMQPSVWCLNTSDHEQGRNCRESLNTIGGFHMVTCRGWKFDLALHGQKSSEQATQNIESLSLYKEADGKWPIRIWFF